MNGDNDLFVYGLLLRGERNHAYLDGCVCVGPARARGQLLDLGQYPGLVRKRGAWANGEVYAIPADRLVATVRRLDRLEGYSGNADDSGNLFVRSRVQLEHLGGVRIASTYFWPHEHRGPTVTAGSWRAWQRPLPGEPLLDAVARIRADVDALPDEVVTGFDLHGHGEITWRGAELCVRNGVPRHPPKHPFGGPPDYGDVDVVSPHAADLAWLVCRLRDEVLPLLESVGKYEFFGGIGIAILGHHAMYGWSSSRATLSAALSAARHIGRSSATPWPLDASNREALS